MSTFTVVTAQHVPIFITAGEQVILYVGVMIQVYLTDIMLWCVCGTAHARFCD